MLALAIHGGAGTIARAALTPAAETQYRAACKRPWPPATPCWPVGALPLTPWKLPCAASKTARCSTPGAGPCSPTRATTRWTPPWLAAAPAAPGPWLACAQVQNPIRAARLVMDATEHVLLAYPGADELAREYGLPVQPPAYFFTQQRYDQLQEAIAAGRMQLDHAAAPAADPNWKKGTVGAVACDAGGHLAAATSTGGMTNKRYARIGDTPLIGAGTWADARCAISCTGHGEYFIRAVAAHDVACLMEYKGLSLAEATRVVVHDKLAPAGGEGGLIAVDALGNLALPFNSEGMYRASRTEQGEELVAIY